MRSGYDPTRRNRKIGTADQGFRADNAMVIPESWHDDRVFYERLADPKVVTREWHARTFTFLVEPTRADCAHACSIDDVMSVLQLLSPADRLLVRTFIFRQPSRKQQILASVWGRMVYCANLGSYRGVAVYLEAQEIAEPLRWSTSLKPSEMQELDRLRDDGHTIQRTGRQIEIHSTLDSVRATQLFRTLPHEIGHYVHYRQALDAGVDHWARSTDEKEAFAHRYAGRVLEPARDAKRIPFPRILDRRSLARDDLKPSWFGVR
ncbi:MAG: hypothetical protein AAGE94_15740 [Acidobacteriota bacterium]